MHIADSFLKCGHDITISNLVTNSVFPDRIKVHCEGAVEKMCPFAERNNDKSPLHQYDHVKEVKPDVILKDIQINEQPHGKG